MGQSDQIIFKATYRLSDIHRAWFRGDNSYQSSENSKSYGVWHQNDLRNKARLVESSDWTVNKKGEIYSGVIWMDTDIP
jgi:hypothetical protein